jgi:hypothetical protein
MPRIYWQSLALDGESKGRHHVERSGEYHLLCVVLREAGSCRQEGVGFDLGQR